MSLLHGDRAIVAGASMAGLAAAKVLSAHYKEVVLIDRDSIETSGSGVRRGVPQGPHVHGLLAKGQQIFDHHFPGLTADMRSAGIRAGDLGENLAWYFNGRQLAPVRTGLLVVGGYRPTLEQHVRARVLDLPNVTLLDRHDVVDLRVSTCHTEVRGLTVQSAAGGDSYDIDGDLVVDALGRASRTPRWLHELGYRDLVTDEVPIDLSYTSCQVRLPDGAFPGLVSLNPVATPQHPRGGFLTSLGEGRWNLSLTGIFGDHAPTDDEGFRQFAADLPVPEVARAVQEATLLTQPARFRMKSSRRHRIWDMRHLPDGLLVLGDALSAFNPVYGQGMTAAALQAQVLSEHLTEGQPRPKTYFRKVSKVLEGPWQISAGGDHAHPQLRASADLPTRVVNRYISTLQAGAAENPRLAEAFLRVAGMIDPPTRLFHPATAIAVTRSRWRKRVTQVAHDPSPSGPVTTPTQLPGSKPAPQSETAPEPHEVARAS